MHDHKHEIGRALLDATIVSIIILTLFYYWFALADRYAIFLYGHTTTGIPPAQPFDTMTASRYWMAGLVAAGVVMVLYTAANWLGGRLAARRGAHFGTPAWWRVWGLCAIALAIGIPAVTMTANTPTLPWSLAAACVVMTLAGLALALLPGRWAAERPADLLWLAADGVALMPTLILWRAIELPGRGLSVSPAVAWIFAIGSVVGGAVWLAVMSRLRVRRGKAIPGAVSLFLAGVGLSYVLMPLAHYLIAGPPGFRYITDAANFFAANLGVQLLALGLAAALALGATALRLRMVGQQKAIVVN